MLYFCYLLLGPITISGALLALLAIDLCTFDWCCFSKYREEQSASFHFVPNSGFEMFLYQTLSNLFPIHGGQACKNNTDASCMHAAEKSWPPTERGTVVYLCVRKWPTMGGLQRLGGRVCMRWSSLNLLGFGNLYVFLNAFWPAPLACTLTTTDVWWVTRQEREICIGKLYWLTS